MGSQSGGSWAHVLGSHAPTKNDKNVMEIVLEKDIKGSFDASDEEVARVLGKLGVDLRPGVHMSPPRATARFLTLYYIIKLE